MVVMLMDDEAGTLNVHSDETSTTNKCATTPGAMGCEERWVRVRSVIWDWAIEKIGSKSYPRISFWSKLPNGSRVSSRGRPSQGLQKR
jgi:hypothetical protein